MYNLLASLTRLLVEVSCIFVPCFQPYRLRPLSPKKYLWCSNSLISPFNFLMVARLLGLLLDTRSSKALCLSCSLVLALPKVVRGHPINANVQILIFFKEIKHGTTCWCSIFSGMSNDILALLVGSPLLFKASRYFFLSNQLVGMVSGNH